MSQKHLGYYFKVYHNFCKLWNVSALKKAKWFSQNGGSFQSHVTTTGLSLWRSTGQDRFD